METERTCGTDSDSHLTEEKSDSDRSASFLKRLTQLQDDEDDEEPVDNTQD